jgi:hypothetical protein
LYSGQYGNISHKIADVGASLANLFTAGYCPGNNFDLGPFSLELKVQSLFTLIGLYS